jgi:hypothetical protein
VTVNVASACDNLDCTGYTGTLTLSAGLTIYGNWKTVAGMTFTPGTQTVTFAATTTGKTITTGGKVFYGVTWNGSGGAWTLQDNFTQTRTTAFTLGTLNLNGKTYSTSLGQTVTLGNGFVLNIGTGYWNCGGGATSVVIPTGATITISTGTFGATGNFTVSGTGTFTATGTATITSYGNVNITSTSPTFSFGTSTLYQNYAASKTFSSTQPLYNYQVGIGTVGATSISLGSDITIQNNFTILVGSGVTRSFSAGSYTINVGGNFANGDTFTAGTSTVVFSDATKTTTVTGSTMFNVLQITTPDKVVRFTAGTTQTVASFIATGTAGHNVILSNVTGTSTWALSDSGGTNRVYYCTISYSAAAGGAAWLAYTTDGNVDGGGNTGWIFAPAGTDKMLLMF